MKKSWMDELRLLEQTEGANQTRDDVRRRRFIRWCGGRFGLLVAAVVVVATGLAASAVWWLFILDDGSIDPQQPALDVVPSEVPRPMSLGFYPGWVSYAPGDVDYSPWTHIGHVGVYPTSQGGLRFGDLSRDALFHAVDAARRAGTKSVLVVGTDGYGSEFRNAASEQYRSRFVAAIVAVVTENRLDGVDIAWVDNVDVDLLDALLSDLGVALRQLEHDVLLSFDTATGIVHPTAVAQIESSVDYVHVMTFWSDGSEQLTAYNQAGVAIEKMTIGVGLYVGDDGDDGYFDVTPERVQEKLTRVTDARAAGVTVWSFQHLRQDWSDPRLEPLRRFAHSGISSCDTCGP